jgi:hypothetical protein
MPTHPILVVEMPHRGEEMGMVTDRNDARHGRFVVMPVIVQMLRAENPSMRAIGVVLLICGAVASLLGMSLIAIGLIGLVLGTHGGPVYAGIAILLGVGPTYLGYSAYAQGMASGPSWAAMAAAHAREI